MNGRLTIPCELTIIPGSQAVQTKFTLCVHNQIAFEGYESELSESNRQVLGLILDAQARYIKSLAGHLKC